MANQQETQSDANKNALKKLEEGECLAEKKLNIYARLLISPQLAQTMEKLATRHEARREILLREQGEKVKKQEEQA